MIRRFVMKEVAHDPEDVAALIAATAMGDHVEAALADPKNPFSIMMYRAREAFIDAQLKLLDTDFTSEAGISQARILQAEANRYRDLVQWLEEARQQSDIAFTQLDQTVSEEDPDVEELMDMHYGNRRAKPAPDA